MKSKTKKDVLYNRLKRQINSGFLLPGTRLIEMELAGNHAVSRTIVREVLKQLAIDGLVELIPYKGAHVAKISLRDLSELYRIQQDLEGLASYLATKNLNQAEIENLEKLHRLSQQYINGEVAEWQKLNTQFHRVFLKHCDNHRLMKLVENHRDQFARYWFLLLSIPGIIEENMKEHEDIIKAVKTRKPNQVRKMMEYHIAGGGKKLLEIIKNVYPSSFRP